MHSTSLRRPDGDAHVWLRSVLGVAIAMVAVWAWWAMQIRI
jgi:hypothetical protein